MLLALGKSYQQLHQVCCDHFYRTITLMCYKFDFKIAKIYEVYLHYSHYSRNARYKVVDGKKIMNSNIFVDKKIDVHEGERIRLIVTANAYIRKCVWIHTGR